MVEFEIKIHNLKAVISQENTIAGKLTTAGSSIEECSRILDTSVSNQYGSIKKSLNSLAGQLSDNAAYVSSMEKALSEISTLYETAEKELAESSLNHAEVPSEKTNTSSEPFLTKDSISSGLSTASKFIKAANDKKKNQQAKTAASMFSMIKSGISLSETEGTAETYTAFAAFSGATLGFGSKLGKSIGDLIGKHGSDSAKAWLKKNEDMLGTEMGEIGSVGGAFGFGADVLKAFQESDSVSAFLKNSGSWISSGKDLIVDLKKIDETVDKSTANPIVNLLGMVSYAAGDIVDLSTDGHPVTADEVSGLLLGTGLNGMKTGVSQITFGLVNVDVERSENIFNKNIDWMAEKISSTGLSTEKQVALGFLAAPVVSVMSVGETFVDIGWQIGDGIKSGVSKIGSTVTGMLFDSSDSTAKVSGGMGGR